MRILVTGGAGFIGANLIRKLLDQGNDIVCIDNLMSGKMENIHELCGLQTFKLIKGDIVDEYVFHEIEGIDQVYNLACPASPKYYQTQPIQTLKACFQGMMNVLEFAKKSNATVLQTSTSEVYGDPMVPEQSETYYGNVNPNGIRACYDEGKRVAETLCCDYRRTYNMDVKIARIFNTYGPYMRLDDGRVVSNFIKAVLDKTEITIYGNGEQTRSLCYISDMVDGLISLMNSSICGPINLGNPIEMTINELALLIKNVMKSDIKIKYSEELEDDPKKRKPDIRLAKNDLKWFPKVSLDEGIEKTVDYYKRIRY